MFNLLRMDLYRVIRSKSLYVCFGILLLMVFTAFGLWYVVVSPQGLELLASLENGGNVQLTGLSKALEELDFLMLFRQICLDGGMYNLMLGIFVMLFVCADFQKGFIKNVMAFHQNRWNYVGSKLLTAAIVDACYLVGMLAVSLVLNQVLGQLVSPSPWQDLVFYMTWVWLLTTAFSALIILLCVLTRSVAVGAVAAVLLGSGLVVTLGYGLLDLLHLNGWLEYTIYLTMSMGPGHFASAGDLKVYAVGAGFLALYTVLTGIFLNKKDI